MARKFRLGKTELLTSPSEIEAFKADSSFTVKVLEEPKRQAQVTTTPVVGPKEDKAEPEDEEKKAGPDSEADKEPDDEQNDKRPC